MDDTTYMMLAIAQAEKAGANDEVPVGAVLIDEGGDVIGLGNNSPITTHDPTSHAEINAMRMAATVLKNYRLVNTTLYVTIEPCIMCMGAIIHARISRIIYGADDPKWGGVHSLYNIPQDLRLNHRPEVLGGICADKAQQLIKDFFAAKRKKT